MSMESRWNGEWQGEIFEKSCSSDCVIGTVQLTANNSCM
jgi:hypothetical protein